MMIGVIRSGGVAAHPKCGSDTLHTDHTQPTDSHAQKARLTRLKKSHRYISSLGSSVLSMEPRLEALGIMGNRVVMRETTILAPK